MNLASFFSTIGFKIDDAALIELKKKVGEVNNAIKGSAKQAAKASTKVTQSFNGHVDAWKAHQKQIAAVEVAHQKALIEDIQRNRKKQELIRKEAQKTASFQRKLELQKQAHQNRLERDRLRETARTRAGRQSGFSTMASGATGIARSALAGYGVFELGRGVFDAAQSRAGFMGAFQSLTGSKGGAESELSFVTKESDRLRISLEESMQSYKQLYASSVDRIGGGGVQSLFTGISEASKVLGLTADQQARGIRAIGQIASKGTAMSEEVIGQWAEAVPGGLKLFADAANMTTEGFRKAMADGKILATDILPKLAQQLHDKFGGAITEEILNSPLSKLAMLENQWYRFKLQFADSGALDVILGIFTDLSETLVKLSKDGTLTSIANSFKIVAKALGTLLKVGADVVAWIDKTIGLENALYIFFGVKMLGWINALRGSVGGLSLDFLSLAKNAVGAGRAILAGGGLTAGGTAGALGAAGVAGWMAGSWLYDKFAIQIQDFLAKDDPRLSNLTKAIPVTKYDLPGPVKAQGSAIGAGVLRIHLDDNLQLQAKMEDIANDQINVQIMKTEAAMPGSR